jgi:hypothetical protein
MKKSLSRMKHGSTLHRKANLPSESSSNVSQPITPEASIITADSIEISCSKESKADIWPHREKLDKYEL